MKIAFSTISCPEWSWGEIIATAKDLGYDGVELRGIEHQMYLPKAAPLSDDQLFKNKTHLHQIGLEIPCLSSACYLNGPDLESSLQEGEEYIELAVKLGVPYIRVLGDNEITPGNKVFSRPQVKEGLQLLGRAAQIRGVTILIETNGHLADSRLLADLLEEVDEPGVGVLWDIHHPFRFFNETPATTTARLGKAIKFLHIKDSRMIGNELKYCMLGKGELPVRAALESLLSMGYNGWLSLEWIKKWNPNIEEPGIVLPHFISTIQRYLKEITG